MRCTDTWQVLGMTHGGKADGRGGETAGSSGPDAAGGQDAGRGRARGRCGRQTAYTRNAMLDEGGIDALRAMPVPGRPARLDERQLQALDRTLLQSPTVHGFGTELWTLERVNPNHSVPLQLDPGGHTVQSKDVVGEIDSSVQNGDGLLLPSELMRALHFLPSSWHSLPASASRRTRDGEVPSIRSAHKQTS